MKHIIPHPRFNEFCNAINRIDRIGALSHFKGTIYRYTLSKYSTTKEMMSGKGAFDAGGRWNTPGSFHAIYCASTPLLGAEEYFAGCEASGFPYAKMMPVMGKAVDVTFSSVLDLRDTGIRRRLKLRKKDIETDPWVLLTDRGEESLCQSVGRAAFECGVKSLLAPSVWATSQSDFNIILIAEHIPAASVKVLRATVRHRK